MSIGIPNRNYGRYLRECVDSVLGQTYPNIECVVFDNGSTDESAEILQGYSDPRLKWYRSATTVPLYANWDRVWRALGGDFVKLLQADDYLEPSYVEECLGVMSRSEVDMAFAAWRMVDAGGKTLANAVAEPARIPSDRPLAKREKLALARSLAGYVQPTCWLVRKSAFPHLQWDWFPHAKPQPFSLDFVFWCHLLVNARAVQYVRKPLAVQRIHKNNDRSSRDSSASLGEQLSGLSLLEQFMDPADLPLLASWRREVCGTFLAYGLRHALGPNSDRLARIVRTLLQCGATADGVRGLPRAVLRRL